MGSVAPQPHPPGDYDVVVVGSGPGGLQTSYYLARHGVRHAAISADDGPGGMFRKWPIFQRLLSWSKLDAPVPRQTEEYEWFDHNSLLGEEPSHRALVPAQMGREFVVPSRPEMERGIAAFANTVPVPVRYGCRWEATRRDGERIVLETSDGPYSCRAAVFAIGVTTPWRSPIAGVETAPHYAETRPVESYKDRTVIVIGKRNSGFELADGLLPWARRIIVVSPQPVRAEVLVNSTVRVRYFQPLEDSAYGGGTLALDAAIVGIERRGTRWTVLADGTTRPGRLELQADDVIVATGFSTPIGDLGDLGVRTVAQGRIPTLTPWWEAIGAPGVFFAGNASQGAPGLRKNGMASTSAAVHGFRYNARLLARHLSERLADAPHTRPHVSREEAAALLVHALASGPALWAQKGYLARALTAEGDGFHDDDIVPLSSFVDGQGEGDGIAVAVETDPRGTIYPCLYVRRRGKLEERPLDPDQQNRFDAPSYLHDIEQLLP